MSVYKCDDPECPVCISQRRAALARRMAARLVDRRGWCERCGDYAEVVSPVRVSGGPGMFDTQLWCNSCTERFERQGERKR